VNAPSYRKNWIFSSKGSCLSTIRALVEDAASNCGFTVQDVNAMKVAVSEACANAIEHGSPKGEADTFQLELTCDTDEITIRVRDNGLFKRKKAAEGNQLSTRGRGTYLMMALMDSVSVEESASGTTVSMSRSINSSEPAPTR